MSEKENVLKSKCVVLSVHHFNPFAGSHECRSKDQKKSITVTVRENYLSREKVAKEIMSLGHIVA